jgi:anaerobic selenocysteine-containing dehydrogenase
MLSNLMMMRGQIGKRGAGLCPVRGHSNVQGDRTMGIGEPTTPSSTAWNRFGFARRAITAMTWWAPSPPCWKEGQGLHRPGRQFRDGHAGHAADLQGAAIVRADGAHRHQAESQPPGSTAAKR